MELGDTEGQASNTKSRGRYCPPSSAPLGLRVLLTGHRCHRPASCTCGRTRPQRTDPFLYLERQFTGLTQIFLIRLLCPGEAKEAPCVTHEASPRSFRNSFSIVSQRSSLPNGPQLLPPAPMRVLLWQNFPRGHRLCCLKNVTFSNCAQPGPHMPV